MQNAYPAFTSEELQNEIWKPVVGFEVDYSVSNLGRVRRDSPGKRTQVGFILNPMLNTCGYPTVGLYSDTMKRRRTVHRLVATAFIGELSAGLQTNHKDGIKINNRIENLEYVTLRQNLEHATRLGLTASGDRNGTHTRPDRTARGERVAGAKLTASRVNHIKQLLGRGLNHSQIARLGFGVSRSMIWNIAHGKSWRHLT